MNKCGDCQVCCEVPSIKELGKSPATKCKFQCETGCSDYENRPTACRTFECLYKIDNLSEEYRPDKCGVMIAHIGGSFKAFRVNDYVNPKIMELIEIAKSKYGINIEGGDYREISPVEIVTQKIEGIK